MDDRVELWEKPGAEETYMIAGWRQWADGGSVSSALPRYLVETLGARQIGRIQPRGFYLFQIPGAHQLLRPEIKLEEGYRKELKVPDNQIFYWRNGQKALVIFLGDEPHLDAEGYAQAFFDVAQALRVRRTASLGGVYAPVPYDRPRNISCTYSLRGMKEEMARYEVAFSDYEGGVSIGSYLLDRAEQVALEYLTFYAMVPYYDLSSVSPRLQPIGLEEDYRAWYDVMVRLNHMFDLGMDLSLLRRRSEEVVAALSSKIDKLEQEHSQLHIRAFVERITEDFVEKTFSPLDDVWESELGDLFDDPSS